MSAAIDQCNCVDQMVGEMVQVERLRTGLPRARRRWADVASIRESISDTLRPWTVPRSIKIIWDADAAPNAKAFVDAVKELSERPVNGR